jgi:hypothetical protein
MSFNGLKRNPEKVISAIKKGKDGYYADKEMFVYIPENWAHNNLADIGEDVYFLGFFAIAVDGYYATDNLPGKIRSEPTEIDVVTVDGELYYEFKYLKGALIAESTVLRNKMFVYSVNDAFLMKGRVPKYCSYEDFISYLFQVKHYCGLNLNTNLPIMSLIAASVWVSGKDNTKLHRHLLNDPNVSEEEKKNTETVGLRNVGIKTTNAMSKVIGSYFDIGVVTAINNPTDKVEGLEEMLRI